jgi:very-short-patch-repair endonuclease
VSHVGRRVSPDPYRSAPAVKIAGWIRELGLVVEEEYPVGPYTVDIYLPEIHAAIEVDGPDHRKKRDETRDHRILETYFMPTFRFTIQDEDVVKDAVKLIVHELSPNTELRLRSFDEL